MQLYAGQKRLEMPLHTQDSVAGEPLRSYRYGDNDIGSCRRMH